MRGLPPIPDGVLLVTLLVDVDELPTSWSFWIFAGGAEELGIDQLEELLGQLQLVAVPLQTALSHAGTRVAACSIARFGTAPARVLTGATPNVGAWTGGQMTGATLTLNLAPADRGRGRSSIVHLPGFPDAFTTDNVRVNVVGFGNALTSGIAFANGVNATPLPNGGRCVLGTLARRTSSGPLPAATFAPTSSVTPGPTIGMLRRRRRYFRSPSPS